jgi:hypothetical protein
MGGNDGDVSRLGFGVAQWCILFDGKLEDFFFSCGGSSWKAADVRCF